MIIILLILLALTCFGLKKADDQEVCLKKEHTDAIKGFFIIIVFYSHILPYLTSSGVSFSPVWDIPANNVIKTIGQLMVVMFLFYSGYGVMESIQRKGDSYIRAIPVKRVLSTFINYSIAILVFLLMNSLLGIHYPFRQYLLSLIAWESVGQSNWYIFAIICCYISTYISFLLFKEKRIAFLATLLLLGVYICLLHEFKENWWYNIILSYPAGMMISLYKKYIMSFLEQRYILCLSGLTLLFVLLFHYRNSTPTYLACAITFAYLVFVISYKFVVKNAFLTWCGKNLFQIYVYQRIPMIALSSLFPDFVRLHHYIYVLCCLAVTMLLAILIKPLSINLNNK